MAKIKKTKVDGALVYPATIFPAVKDPNTGQTLTEKLSELGSNLLYIEQGGFASANGSETTSTKRVRNKGYIKGNYSISAPKGYIISSVLYFEESNYAFNSLVSIGNSIATIGKEGMVARVVFGKEDNSEFTPADFVQIETIKLLSDEISATNTRIDNLNNKVDGLNNKLDSSLTNSEDLISLAVVEKGYVTRLYDENGEAIQLGVKVYPTKGTNPAWMTYSSSVKAGEKYIIGGAQTSSFSKLFCLTNKEGIVVDYSSKDNSVYNDYILEIKEDGVLYYNNALAESVKTLVKQSSLSDYLAEQLSLKIGKEELLEIENEFSYGLFAISSSFLHTDGSVRVSSGGTSCVTGYIPYSLGAISVRGNSGETICLLHFFDANKSFIGAVSGVDKKNILINITEDMIPEGTKYFRATGVAENGVSVKSNLLSYYKKEIEQNKINIIPSLEYGILNSSGSNIVADSDDAFFKNIRTSEYIVFSNSFSIPIDDSKYTLDVYWYNIDGEFLLKSKDFVVPSSEAKMLKFVLSKIDGTRFYTLPIIHASGILATRKNSYTSLSWKRFSYAVDKVSCDSSNEPFDKLKDTTNIVYDKGVLMLPPNYSAEGEPVRLAIFCHGSGGFLFNSTSAGSYDNFCKYIAKEGYAVMIVHGRTNESYSLYGNAVQDNFGTPQAMACYKAAYKWVLSNYNIKRECVCWGKSLGGVMMGNLSTNKMGIPMLACGGHGPTLDLFTSTLRIRPAIERMSYAKDMSMKGDTINFEDESANNYYTKVSQSVWNEYFKDNAWRVIGYNPLWNGTINVEPSELLALTYQHGTVETGVEYPEERQVFESLPKHLGAPIKIWAAKDDVNVDPRFSDYMQKMCRLGGSYYELRWLPKDTGKHWATDAGTEVNGVLQKPISAEVKPRYSEEVLTMPVAYIELVAWWRRFE